MKAAATLAIVIVTCLQVLASDCASRTKHCSISTEGIGCSLPNSLNALNDEGEAVLLAAIGPDGCVRSASVENHVPKHLDSLISEAARLATFHPATKDGKPVAVMVRLHVRYVAKAGRLTFARPSTFNPAPTQPPH